VRDQAQKNEGEGNKTAARRYNRAATEHARSGKPEKEARDAAKALDGREGEDLERAAEEGRRPARGTRE